MLRFFSGYVLLCAPMNLIIYPDVYESDWSRDCPRCHPERSERSASSLLLFLRVVHALRECTTRKNSKNTFWSPKATTILKLGRNQSMSNGKAHQMSHIMQP